MLCSKCVLWAKFLGTQNLYLHGNNGCWATLFKTHNGTRPTGSRAGFSHPPFLSLLPESPHFYGRRPSPAQSLTALYKPPCTSAASEKSDLPFLTVLWGGLRVGLARWFFCSIWHRLGVTHSACSACGWAGLEAPRSFYSTLAELVFLLRPCHTSWDGCSHSGWWTGLRILPWEQASKKEEAEASSPLKSWAKKSKEKGMAEEEMFG